MVATGSVEMFYLSLLNGKEIPQHRRPGLHDAALLQPAGGYFVCVRESLRPGVCFGHDRREDDPDVQGRSLSAITIEYSTGNGNAISNRGRSGPGNCFVLSPIDCFH